MDLTILFYTSNYINESFAKEIRDQLIRASEGIPIISISQKPMDFGENICVGDISRSHLNIYRQILIGAKAATTEYVALAEDDVLYSPSHFTSFRPDGDTFAYNLNKWSIFTWVNPPTFSYIPRMVINALIAPRKLLVEALTERFTKWPDDTKTPVKYWGDLGRYENYLHVTVRKTTTFNSSQCNIVFSHTDAYGYLGLGNRKKMGDQRVTELDGWGTASDIIKIFKERNHE